MVTVIERSHIYQEVIWEVHDPWDAVTVAYFFREEDAKLFQKAYQKRWKKRWKQRDGA